MKKKQTKMEKLKQLVDDWIDPPSYYGRSKRGRPKNLSVYLINEMWRIYQELEHNGKAYFLPDDLVPYLKKCGIKVTAPHDEMINWLAERTDITC